MRICTLLLCGLSLLLGCQAPRQVLRKSLKTHILDNAAHAHNFTGFALFDPVKQKLLYNHQAERYFTPASNTKLYTLYTALNVLGDSLAALRYAFRNDTLFIMGTGDPSLMHLDLPDNGVLAWLSGHADSMQLVYVEGNMQDAAYGPGWAWDDMQEPYSCPRSALPLHGNFFRMVLKGGLVFDMPISVDELGNAASTLELALNEYDNARSPVKIATISHRPDLDWQTLYGLPIDSVLIPFMHNSDNFFAEQLMLMTSGQLFHDTLSVKKAIRYSLDSLLADLPHRPRWVDGSGLSRYNLFTPQDNIFVLNKLWQEQPLGRLLAIFPAGGVSGTIKKWYAGKDSIPFVYAKTGTLSNNHCLSGFIHTKNDRWYIFSFMHNHYLESSSEMKISMDRILREIYRKM